MADEKKIILHVDDDSDVRDAVKTVLEKEGYGVVAVDSGKEALKAMGDNDFALILLDVMMPDMSGWELFTNMGVIKPDYKVIFLTVLEVTQERLKQLNDNGVSDYITKPFDKVDLVARVKRALE